MNDKPFWTLLIALLDSDKAKLIEFYEAQLAALRHNCPSRLRFTPALRGRLGKAAKALGLKTLRSLTTLVTPDTLFRWYRQGIREKWDFSRKRGPGRPSTKAEIARLILRLAGENPSWGCRRLRDALKALGHEVSKSTILGILKKHGLEPAPQRVKGMSWGEFFRIHRELLVGCDFFTWEVLTPFGLVTHYVLFFIRIATREVHLAGITAHPDGNWMKQMARNLTMPGWGFLKEGRILLHDRDSKFTLAFREIIRNEGIKTLMLPFRSPNLNAYAERWVRSVKEECLSKVLILGEPMLRNALRNYIAHHQHERNHQGLNGVIPFPYPKHSRAGPRAGPVVRSQRLGGLLNYYYREAV